MTDTADADHAANAGARTALGGRLQSLRQILPLAWPVFIGQLAVLAYSTTAVPDTLGGAGVQFAPKDLEYAAEMLGELTYNDALRTQVIAGQRRRLADFSDDRIRKELERLTLS